MHIKSKILTDKNPVASSKEKLLRDLWLIVADIESHLHINATHPGEDEADAKARIQENLKVTRMHLIEADTPAFTNNPGQDVHNNPWRSIGISACANMIVAMQNARH